MQVIGDKPAPAGPSPLRARLSAWLRSHRGRSYAQEDIWAARIGHVITGLEGLNRNTEQDFLQIGGRLMEFIETVNLLSTELTATGNVIAGEQGLRASDAITCALDGSMEMGARYADRNSGLANIRHEAGRLKNHLSAFGGIVSSFHTLGVLTRIETARLGSGGSDFGSLADDVKALAGNIEAKVESALDATARLIPSVESAMLDISALEQGQAKELHSVITKLRASLTSFRDMQTRVQNASTRLGAGYGAISDAFKKVVVSIQFHDITRQQVEHVIEVLRRLCSQQEGEEDIRSHRHAGIGTILALQSSQLNDASEKFASSVATVTASLDDIAAHVREMTDESRTLTGQSEDEKNSFFVQMEQGSSAILSGLKHCADAESATVLTSCGLAETIGQMQGSVDEIRAIEVHIQRMALNGSIRAAHLGSSGDALSVLAGSMLQLALESRQISDALVKALRSMSSLADLSGRGTAGDGRGHEECFQRMRSAVAELHLSSEHSFSQIARIVDRAASLREELSATSSGFSIGPVFADAIGRARETLQQLIEEAQSGLLPDRTAVEPELAAFTSHYTMQAERDVHEGIAPKRSSAAEPAELTEPATSGSDEMGENIEFF